MTEQEKAVFAISDNKEVVCIGLSEVSINYLKAEPGITHTFDLIRFGVPVKIMIFYGKDHQSIKDMLKIDNDTLDVSGIDVGFGDKEEGM